MLVCTWDRCDTDGMVRRFIMVVCCLKKNQSTPRPSEHPPVMGEKVVFCCLKKNQNAPRPSEHPPVMGGKCQNV